MALIFQVRGGGNEKTCKAYGSAWSLRGCLFNRTDACQDLGHAIKEETSSHGRNLITDDTVDDNIQRNGGREGGGGWWSSRRKKSKRDATLIMENEKKSISVYSVVIIIFKG